MTAATVENETVAAKLRRRANTYSSDAHAARKIQAWGEAAILQRLADELRTIATEISQ